MSVRRLIGKAGACVAGFAMFCAVSVAQSAGTEVRPALPPDFDATVAGVMKDWSVPGVAVAVVRAGGDTVIKAYGKRQWDRDPLITEGNIFHGDLRLDQRAS
jgi:CubicO group peptidase (beta-lactamase class C family)